MSKVIIFSLIVLVVMAGLLFWQQKNKEEAKAPTLEWVTEDAGTDESIAAPFTKVSLKVAGVEREIGTYLGSCFEIGTSAWALESESDWPLLDNEISGVLCWFAGGGKEIGVFEEEGKLVVKTGDVEEGTAEGGDFRGNYKTVFEIE